MIAVKYYSFQNVSKLLPFRQRFMKPSGSFRNAAFEALTCGSPTCETSWGTS